VTTGVAGFAMGLVVSGIWLHIITPMQTATLMVGYGLVTQSYGIWKLRHALSWRKVAPFIIGGVVGVPIGVMLLTYIDPAYLRIGVGLLLVLYGIYGLARPAFKPVQSGVSADVGIGFLNGLLGGLTGLAGIVVTIWCQLRGWPKDVQRTVFQPVLLAALVMTAASLSIAGAVTAETVKLYLLGLPVLLAGLWSGLKLYGKLDDAAFRKVILLLLLVSGLALIVPLSMFRWYGAGSAFACGRFDSRRETASLRRRGRTLLVDPQLNRFGEHVVQGRQRGRLGIAELGRLVAKQGRCRTVLVGRHQKIPVAAKAEQLRIRCAIHRQFSWFAP